MLCHHTRYVVLRTDLGILYDGCVIGEPMVIAHNLNTSNMVENQLNY